MERGSTHVLAAVLIAVGFSTAAPAQTPVQPRDPNMPAPQNTIPEKIRPEEPSTTGSTGSGGTLSEKLEQSDGVIRPPTDVDPEMRVPAPVPNPGTTPVIPPPGSPGGNPTVDPK